MERDINALGNAPAICPSGYAIADLVAGRDRVGRTMTATDMDAVEATFARSAALACKHGFDGVEIHASHDILLDQFLWSATNRCRDDYGGPPENRARIPARVIAVCRAATQPDFPILAHVSQFKIGAYDARIADTAEDLSALMQPLATAGADILHGSPHEAWTPACDGSGRNLAAERRC
ncbi:hypothetical protein RM533_13135 [Croceicoccus sp. F390]|uniref:NADH:flavin oxidoreductase/NADH oxidase N-terminal domain-containing protein n=1 Tax=Croceicoccus esteveae TaxID=3075597 RepID=A0ABU2ZL51_9SPHN|nr:hypothetical protein [Croceicoccus sp. F390]MDT0577110.1 hypothetical protein [Croceicoccus sp. F390]